MIINEMRNRLPHLTSGFIFLSKLTSHFNYLLSTILHIVSIVSVESLLARLFLNTTPVFQQSSFYHSTSLSANRDTTMEDPFFPLQNLTSDLDVNMEEVSEIPSGSIPQHPLFIDSDSDDDCASDSTLLGDEIELETYSFNGLTLKPNKTVETRDGHFLRIERILEDLLTDQISLTGQVFKRTRLLNGLVEAKRNELVMIMKPGRSTAVVSLAEIVRIRELVITNQHFPAVSYREIEPRNSSMSESYINNHCRLVCRLKCAIVSKNKGYVRPLADHESDKGFSISDADLRQQFRGPTIKGGACSGWSDAEMAFEREERRRSQGIAIPGFQYAALDAAENRYHKRRYTFVDGFCGAGGASRGAQIAGFKILGAFDHNPHAVATYRQNFPHAKCEQLSAYDYAMSLPDDFKTDVLHLSPPCPTFSPMHVRPGRDDDMNEASFLATEVLIKKTKPRIVTLEETFGLVRTEANLLWFRSMIQIFTKLGFSVRWQVSNSLDFGLAQPRKRLIVFASW